MANSQRRVSDEFSKYEQTVMAAPIFQKAKEAENNSGGVNLPLGTEGEGHIMDVTVTMTKPSTKNPKGLPRLAITVGIDTPEKFAGRKVIWSRMWFSTTNATSGKETTAAERFEWMLNDLENLGFPREIRTKPDFKMGDFVDWALAESRKVCYRIVESYDKKSREAVLSSAESQPSLSDMPGAPSGKKKVLYNTVEWEIIEEKGDVLVIRNPAGREREVNRSEVTFI